MTKTVLYDVWLYVPPEIISCNPFEEGIIGFFFLNKESGAQTVDITNSHSISSY
jgi:hypothetical protein